MNRSYLLSFLTTLVSLGAILVLSNPIACSSTNNETGVTTFTVSNLGQNVALTEGVTTAISFPVTFDVKSMGGPYNSLRMDLQAHLSAVAISIPGVTKKTIPFPLHAVKTAHAAIEGSQLYVRIASAAQIDTVCTEGELYGPFDISLAENFQPTSIDPPSAEASQQTLDVINRGAYSVCVQIIPVITGVADLNSLMVDMDSCTEAPADIAGTWTGPYSCTGICPESGTVTLEIIQDAADPAIASYTDDSGAAYEGWVCGNRFSFSGGETDSYDESGTFVLNEDGTASKTSTYIEVGEGTLLCSGACTDTLTRIP